MVNERNDLRERLEQTATDELNRILRAETEKAVPDDDLVLLILGILEERDREAPLVLSSREKTAWKRFRRNARRRGRSKTARWSRGVALAASLMLVLGFLFTVVPQETKAKGLHEIWTWCADTVLAFFTSEKEEILPEYEYKTENPGLQQLRDTVVEYGGTERALMMWIPEGYELAEIEIDEMRGLTSITTTLEDEENWLIICVDIYDTVDRIEFYKNMQDPKEKEFYGNTHYAVQNRDSWTAAWQIENVVCTVTLECQEDTLDAILRSIYVMEAVE